MNVSLFKYTVSLTLCLGLTVESFVGCDKTESSFDICESENSGTYADTDTYIENTSTVFDTSSDTETDKETDTEADTETDQKTDTVVFPEPVGGIDICHVGFGENRDRVVVIDAGHQRYGMSEKEPNGPGSDVLKAKVTSGTYGRFTGVKEYELTLTVALALRNELMKCGYTVVMVREVHDVEVSNIQRAQIANKYAPSKENGYISAVNIRIHANGSDVSSANGALMCCPTQNNPYKIGELFSECKSLAEYVIDDYCNETGINKRKNSILYGDDMTGTNWCEIPTTILEMGFMTNEGDDRLMQAAEFGHNAAVGIANGIYKYFDSIL